MQAGKQLKKPFHGCEMVTSDFLKGHAMNNSVGVQSGKRYNVVILIVLLNVLLLLGGCGSGFRSEDIREYDPEKIVAEYHGDLDSGLLIFPEQATIEKVKASYSASLTRGLFDTDGWIILDCEYNEDDFTAEIKRLQAISLTIQSKDEKAENKILYDEDSYQYPAYITIDGFDHTYEYALIKEEKREVIYLYFAYPNNKILSEYSEYVKKDRSAYDSNDNTGFSLYNHSFDGGKSWIEFDD